jgi:hypothetical protein
MSIFIIIVIIIFLIHYISNNKEYFITQKIESSIDKRKYRVIKNYSNIQEASDTMYKINEFIIAFLKHMRNKYIFNKNKYKKTEVEFVERMIKNYNPDSLFEHNPSDNNDTSYVVNKGEKFGICIRNKLVDKNIIHDIDIIKFVVLHELSHLGCISYGHGIDFWEWFKFNLIESKKANLYIPKDYNNNSINYCGLNVTYSPYFNITHK